MCEQIKKLFSILIDGVLNKSEGCEDRLEKAGEIFLRYEKKISNENK